MHILGPSSCWKNVFFVKDSNHDGRLTMNYGRSCAASHASQITVRESSSGCVLVLNDQSLLGDAVLALVEIGCSTSCRTNARQVSSRVGAGLDDGGTAGGSGTDEVEGTFWASHQDLVYHVDIEALHLLTRSVLVQPGGREIRTWPSTDSSTGAVKAVAAKARVAMMVKCMFELCCRLTRILNERRADGRCRR